MQFKYLILLTLFIFLKTPLLATESLYFQSHDWLAVCDNTNTCRISGYSSDNTDLGGISVLFTQEAGVGKLPKAKVKIAFLNDEGFPQDKAPTFSIEMLINKKNYGIVSIEKDELVGSLSIKQTKALLSSLKKKVTLTWKMKNHVWQLSDKGATAVLLKASEYQHRLDMNNPSLKVEKNKQAISQEKRLPPTIFAKKILSKKEILISKSDKKALEKELVKAQEKKLILSDKICDYPKGDDNEITLYTLSTTKRLVTKLCWTGAYNSGSYFWVINKNPPFQPHLITTNGTAFYIEENIGTIASDHKSRGLGDCWTYKNFVWTGETFSLTSEGSTGLCRLIAAGGAWDLPTYTSQVTFK